jgi:hypothetical protein
MGSTVRTVGSDIGIKNNYPKKMTDLNKQAITDFAELQPQGVPYLILLNCVSSQFELGLEVICK